MLALKSVTKQYPTGGEVVDALKGVSLSFRRSEFVSVLGPSGCGKTTLLNIIGGLDQYTSGDLLINGRSTKEFKDRDWDAYRNHSIGFVFQTYNLIPHQTVLQNVELALTLSGVGKAERRKRAKAALEKVGLGDQLRKRPAQMSGGQMQRVAIARAIVNDPDIILADEPTGALDTETSVQVMEILKEIAKDRLVIMVTHNPELAQQYSTRIIRILDGRILDDSAPLSPQELEEEAQADRQRGAEQAKQKKPSMSFGTSFGLSLKNLFTKKGRTTLTAFAGSIGIIGIALIYAVSQGTTNYIDAVQEETLSAYPLTLEAQHMDMGSLLDAFLGKAKSGQAHDREAVYQKTMFYDLMNALNTTESRKNDLKSFKAYLEKERSDPQSETGLQTAVSGVQYTYDTQLQVYTENVDGDIIICDSQKLMQDILRDYMGMDLSALMDMRDSGSFGGMSLMGSQYQLWQEMLPGDNGRLISPMLEKQYDVIYGSWPTRYDEVMLVLDDNNELDDMTLYAMGLKSREEVDAVMQAVKDKTEVTCDEKGWSYEEICNRDFRVVLPADCYVYDESTGGHTDLRNSDAGLKYLYDNGMNLRVCGILRPNADAIGHMLSGSIAYTSKLTEYIIREAKKSDVVQAQLADPAKDVLSGLPFKDGGNDLDERQKAEKFRAYLDGLDEAGKAAAYVKIKAIPPEETVRQTVDDTLSAMTRQDMEDAVLQAFSGQMGVSEEEIRDYIAEMSDEDMNTLFSRMIEEQFRASYAQQIAAQLLPMGTEQLSAALEAELPDYSDTDCALYYENVPEFSESDYESNLISLGCVDLDSPASINLYAASFEEKETIEKAIAAYNEGVDDLARIQYTDYVGLMMSSITTIINAITYVLIAFVAVSLIVSSIMIGVITLISVQERTKEIGILRAIGASKKNVSSLFNAETVMIGFASGALGVLITYILCIPINLILHELTDINNLSASLPLPAALVLILISMALTLIAGIIPSRSAAKKDPVVALRSE